MKLTKKEARVRRHHRVRSVIFGSPERPRIVIFRSNRHISAQVIDDEAGRTLLAVASMSKAVKQDGPKSNCNVATATRLGKQLGEKLKAAGIERVVFDRGGYLYHGVIKAFAEGVRSADEQNHFNF